MRDLRLKGFTMAALAVIVFTGSAVAELRTAASARTPTPVAAPSEKDLGAEQRELIRLLRLSPTLTTVVEHDPTLLSNQEYVRRNNPQLAQYLTSHPEITLNPNFYLFSELPRGENLEQAVWPEYTIKEAPRTAAPPLPPPPLTGWKLLAPQVVPFALFVCVLGAMLWLFRQFVENRRWSRIFNLQTEVHNKLIDRFGSSQELLAYMNSEAGRRFLEAEPLSVNLERKEHIGDETARILMPLQIGLVLFLLGLGFFLVRNADHALQVPMQVLAAAVLMPGLGFILSGAAIWLIAGRPGLTPERRRGPQAPFDTRETRDGQ